MKFALRTGSWGRPLQLLALAGALLGGCAHNTSGVFTAGTRVVIADERGTAVELQPGQPLRSGQVFALEFELQQPAHVYIVHRRGGLLGTVYPGVGLPDNELPSGMVRLPGRDSYMQMPAIDHKTRLCLLLSAQPLLPEQRRCWEGRGKRAGQPAVQLFLLEH